MSVTLRVRLNCLVACAASLAMTLAACGGSSSAPKSLPTLPTATDPAPSSASPTPTATSKKAELAAATAVVDRYYLLLNAPTTVHNAALIARLMVEDCSCLRVARSTRSVALDHHRYYGRTTVRARKASLDSPQAADVLVRYDYTDTGIETLTGRRLTHIQGRVDNQIDVRLDLVKNLWRISALEVIRNGHPA
jgi:hypothetical protein